jgi:para-nitrobenzyl esterase
VVWLAGPATPDSDQAARAAAARFEGDMRLSWDMWIWAKLAAAHGNAHVYVYDFARVPPYRAGDRSFGWGAGHGMEMPYVFDHLDQQKLPWTQQDRTLATAMSTYWVNFAKTGNPNGPFLPACPAFTMQALQAMILGITIAPSPVKPSPGLRRIDRLYRLARTAMFWK